MAKKKSIASVKRVLILPGGGMRGLPASLALASLEKLTGKPIYQSVDLVAGTSIGGILALLIASGVPAADTTQFFVNDGPNIFHKSIFDFGFLGGALYSASVIEKCLQTRFANKTIDDLKVNTLITGIDTVSRKPFLTKSYDTSNLLIEGCKTPLWQPARWTSAAEHYFPGYQYGDKVIWDGGNSANNPALYAMADTIKLWGKDQRVKFLVLGTGSDSSNYTLADFINPNPIKLLKLLISLLFDAAEEDVDYIMTQLYSDDYIVCQPTFPNKVSLDDASSAGIANLQSAGETFVTEIQDKLKQFVA